ncbi:amino acid ABC transporter ATP-binding protein [Bordetella genomosp. 9]|uniref:amino acid ABC transporter ATP-binding protein n=1 Tax=Bordetella genomosp. 9 TaxID=1416803 RepID=UPI000A28E107|nr:amino acid ABC transporter ATP-binding protein [Bordetella genomosp. 9]ARP91354.1 amino acid ABC transporter ATP-binding protein [Bordetella genomosp. 9]
MHTQRDSAPLVDIRGVHKRFGENEVLKGIDLQVARSEVICIIGKSGSGKSTLLRCINGLESFDQGQIVVGGQRVLTSDAGALRELRQKVGMIFQQFNLFPSMTAGENVMLAPRLVLKRPRDECRDRARRLLARVGLEGKFDASPHQLSGGQQQRVAIARALAMDPEVLLCDEMTSALDPELVGEVLQVIEQLARDGATLIIVTHEMGFARKVSDRVIFMHHGRVHEMGTPEEIFGSPRSPELRSFLSFPAQPPHNDAPSSREQSRTAA